MYDFLTDYPHATEELDKGYLQSYGLPITTAIFCDADHAHDKKTRRCYQSVIVINPSLLSIRHCYQSVIVINPSLLSIRHCYQS